MVPEQGERMQSSAADPIVRYGWILVLILIFILYKAILRAFFGTVIISKDEIGIVNKKWVLVGKYRTLPDGAIVALNGEAGLQADTLAPGIHFGLWAWQYQVSKVPFTTIDKTHIGIVEARDGHPLSGGRVLAKTVECNSFQDARGFLTRGGERGPQISIIPPGTYRINTALFQVAAAEVLEIPDNMVGVVTTKDGKPLATGEIAGKEVAGHNMYQDAEAFITNGGHKGLQEQVVLAGRYFINPRFATVEIKPMTEVPIANVGVVIAYVGDEGKDVTGDSFKHGNLVSRGQKGVWFDPLDPGKYPINPFTHKVEIVPTANIVLNWATGKSEAHKLDEKLSTITVRSSDGFTFNLDVSQIIHIPRNDAPKVIARFRDDGQPGDAGAGADHRQLLPQRRADLGRDRIFEEAQRTATGSQDGNCRGSYRVQRERHRYADRRHHAAGSADEDAHRPQDRRAGAGDLQDAATGRRDAQRPATGPRHGRHAGPRGRLRAERDHRQVWRRSGH
jgi:uncharacterized membrane protein YqiK